MDPRVEDLPGSEQPVRVVDETPVGRLEALVLVGPIDGDSVDPRAALLRVDVEESDVRSPGLVDSRDAIVARVAVPGVREAGHLLTLPDDHEVEAEQPRLLPGGHSAHRRDELLADRVGLRIALDGTRDAEAREKEHGRHGGAPLHARIICPRRREARLEAWRSSSGWPGTCTRLSGAKDSGAAAAWSCRF